MRSRYGVSPPRWKPQPAPRIMHRSICCGVATTPSSSMCPTSTVRAVSTLSSTPASSSGVPAVAGRVEHRLDGRVDRLGQPLGRRGQDHASCRRRRASRGRGSAGTGRPAPRAATSARAGPTAGPTRSNSSNGGIGRPSGRSARSATSTGVPFSTASTITPSSRTSSRLTTKPGRSATSTAVLRSLAATANPVASASSDVCSACTTSTSGIAATGLKKCSPTTRSGCCRSAAIAVTDSAEVFVARIVVGEMTRLQLGEHLLLQVEDLGDRLDDEVARRELGEVGGAVDRPEQTARGATRSSGRST